MGAGMRNGKATFSHAAHADGASHALIDARFFAPPEHLSRYFTTFYRLEVRLPEGETVSDYLQPEWAGMRFFAQRGPRGQSGTGHRVDGALVQAGGPTSLPVPFTLWNTRLWGFGFLPLGWATFIGTHAAERANWMGDGFDAPDFARHAALHGDLFADSPDDEGEFAKIVAHFEDCVSEHPDTKRIMAIHHAIMDPDLQTIGALADEVGMSTRTLERCCAKHFGFSPSVLLRRQRLMRTIAAFMLDDAANWSAVIDRNYHDQSHFTHEFQHFMAMSPSEYAALDKPILRAFMAERMRIWGSPVQTLDPPARQPAGRQDYDARA